MNAEKIIDLLENAGDDDNKKFALLIIFTNLIKENKLDELRLEKNPTCPGKCKQLNERLFHSIDPHFLARLITATKLPDNCSKHIYKSISMGILAQFLDYPHLIVDPILLAKMDTIVSILTLRPTIPDKNEPETVDAHKENELIENLIFDTLRYLYAVGEHSPDYLTGHGTSLISVLMNEIILKNDAFYYTKEINQVDDLTDLEKTSESDTGRDPLLFVACKLLLKLFKNSEDPTSKVVAAKFGSANAKRKEPLKTALIRLLQEINKHQDELKFNLIKILNYFMSSMDFYHFILFHDDGKEILADGSTFHDQTGLVMFKILNDLFKSAKSLLNLRPSETRNTTITKKLLDLDNKYTNIAFGFLNNFVRFYQFEFIYMKNRQFFYLFIHLLCSQIGYNLKMRSTMLNDSPQANAEAFADKHDRSTIKFLNKMSIYYSLLEEIVIILSTASPFDDNADDDDYEFDEDEDEHVYGSDDDEELDDYGNLYDARGRPANKKLIEDKQKEKEKVKKAQKELKKEENEPELNDAIKVIVELLQYLIEYLTENIGSESFKENFESCLLVVSSMRLVICWMCHETLLEDDLVKLLPKLISFSEYYQSNTKSLSTSIKLTKEPDFDSSTNDEFSIFKVILSGVQRILGDKKQKLTNLKEILKTANESVGMHRSASSALPTSFSSMSISSSRARSGGVDQVKVEFEIHELEELISELNTYRETCLKHLNV